MMFATHCYMKTDTLAGALTAAIPNRLATTKRGK
jgi:hypothetical protein